MPGYNARGQASSIGDLLKDPSTPQRTPQRPSTASTPGRRSVLTGESEREDPKGLRKFQGCNVYEEVSHSAFSNRKNFVSTPDSEYKHVKGRADVRERRRGSMNPLTAPNSVAPGSTHKKYLGRMSDHHGNIISEPPKEETNLKPTRNHSAGARIKQKFDHGDIINGKNQSLNISSGKGRASMNHALTNRSTMDLLHWPGPETPQRRADRSDRRGNSSRMQEAMSQSRPTTAPPGGQSSIDRLAHATAYAVIAPRSNAAGIGIADLRQ